MSSTIQHHVWHVLGPALCLIACGCFLAPRPRGGAAGATGSPDATSAPDKDPVVSTSPRGTDEDQAGEPSASSKDAARSSGRDSTAVVDVDAKNRVPTATADAERYRDVDLARVFERGEARPLPLHNEDPERQRLSKRSADPGAEPALELSVSTNGPERPAALADEENAPTLSSDPPPATPPRYRPVRAAPRAVRVT